MSKRTFGDGDTLTVGMGSGQASFEVTVRLRDGACSGQSQQTVNRKPKRAEISSSLTDEELALVRADAVQLHLRGDYEYRDQFAQAGVGFVVVLDGVSVSADYHLDGGRTDFERVYDIAARYAWDATSSA